VKLGKLLDLVKDDIILECFFGSGPRVPVFDQVHQNSAINRDDPIVWEVLIANLAHLRLLVLQDKRAEWEQRKNDRRLVRQCKRSVSWIVSVHG
jgi:hypothetical protein